MFDVIAAPYLGRTPRAMSGKLQVLDRGADMVLAEHYTPVHHGRLTAATLETSLRPAAPDRVRLVPGPVPHITEEFTLTEQDGTTRLGYSGELGTDFAAAGRWWADHSRPPGRRPCDHPSPASRRRRYSAGPRTASP